MTTERNREFLYGRQPVLETLRAGRRKVFRLAIGVGVRPSPEMKAIRSAAQRAGVRVQAIKPGELARLSGGGHHQGVVAEVTPYPYTGLREALRGDRATAAFYLVLDHLQDPQNVGSLLRSAEAAGVTAVFLPARRAAGITPAAVRVSAGASEHLQIVRAGNVAQCLRRLKDERIWVAGLEKAPGSELYTQRDLTGPLALVVGSEGRGMKRVVREHCDFLVHLPMAGHVTSLNAGVAGALAMYEVVRQREASGAEERS